MAEKVDIKEIKTKVGKGLEVARWKLLEKHPFIGEMLLRFSIIPTYDRNCLTAATDGNKIFFDCEFYSTLTPGQRRVRSQRLQRMLCLPHKTLPLHSTKQSSQIRTPKFDLPADAFQ